MTQYSTGLVNQSINQSVSQSVSQSIYRLLFYCNASFQSFMVASINILSYIVSLSLQMYVEIRIKVNKFNK